MILKIFVVLMCICLGCSQPENKPKAMLVSSGRNFQKLEGNTKALLRFSVEYFIFGEDCGESRCASLYKLTEISENPILFADYKQGRIWSKMKPNFNIPILARDKMDIAMQVLEALPMELLIAKNEINVFGCPGCGDGSYVYLEFYYRKKRKLFIIDVVVDEKVPKRIFDYGNFVKSKIDELEKIPPTPKDLIRDSQEP